jgi:hypothetical protein
VASEFVLERDGVRLAGLDFGGDGESFVLLHGLAGYAGAGRCRLRRARRAVAYASVIAAVPAVPAKTLRTGQGSITRRPRPTGGQPGRGSEAVLVAPCLGSI